MKTWTVDTDDAELEVRADKFRLDELGALEFCRNDCGTVAIFAAGKWNHMIECAPVEAEPPDSSLPHDRGELCQCLDCLAASRHIPRDVEIRINIESPQLANGMTRSQVAQDLDIDAFTRPVVQDADVIDPAVMTAPEGGVKFRQFT